MKKVSKIALLISVLFLVLSFTACSSSSGSSEDDSSKKEESAENKTAEEDGNTVYKGAISSVNYTATFDTDKNFEITSAYNSYAVETDWKGTYTGDASKDGTIKITITKKREGRDLLDYSGEDAVQDITISGGKFEFDSVEYTRQ